MAELLVKPHTPNEDGAIMVVTPDSAGWTYVGFAVHHLTAGQIVRRKGSADEICVVILSGSANVRVGDRLFLDIGERQSVFDDMAPYCVYAPRDHDLVIDALGDTEIALCSAPGGGARSPYVIAPNDIHRETRGTGTNTRHVNAILPNTGDAESLLIYEVITPGGNWSSYPPHKHDTDDLPNESALEETYYHKLNPPQGFAFQRVYTDERDIDETMTVHDGDLVLVPRGYHPVGAPHGYDLYYLNVMAGAKRSWVFKNDPAHEWMLKK